MQYSLDDDNYEEVFLFFSGVGLGQCSGTGWIIGGVNGKVPVSYR